MRWIKILYSLVLSTQLLVNAASCPPADLPSEYDSISAELSDSARTSPDLFLSFMPLQVDPAPSLIFGIVPEPVTLVNSHVVSERLRTRGPPSLVPHA